MIWSGLAIACLIYLCYNKRYRWFYILYKTLHRDLIGGWRFLKVNYKLYTLKQNNETVPALFTKTAKANPNKVAFYFEDQTWTFQELEDFSNKVANYFRQEGYRPGETVALLLENRPEYVAIWLGLSKVGVVAALINTNLVSVPLIHSITAGHSKAVIYGSDYENAINGIKDKLLGLKLYRFKTTDILPTIQEAIDLNDKLEATPATSPSDLISNTRTRDKLIYIFTSGTTGLPKAAVISHARYIFAAVGVYEAVTLNRDDIFYNPLPLYHSSGGMVGVGCCILYGLTSVIRKKFSASNYFNDCVKHKCTVANYIGEICRYVLAAHKQNTNIVHKVRLIVGNGLRKEIWEQFVSTFHIPHVYEIYGSTEGNANLVNVDNTPGAVGFLPRYAGFIYPLCLIKCDEDTKEPIRNSEGFCITCEPDEAGILIGRIKNSNAFNDFSGYADEKATKKKVIENVFKEGDKYFNSGDILTQNELGYLFFKDRTGDTYRWKGENVATSEVETVISEVVGLKDAVVYGVEIPNVEGRCGMIALVDPDKSVNLEKLAQCLKDHLPSYAIPLFLRIVDSLPMTGTFKVKKIELQKEGYDMSRIKDPLYFYDTKKVMYVPLDEVYNDIVNGKLRL